MSESAVRNQESQVSCKSCGGAARALGLIEPVRQDAGQGLGILLGGGREPLHHQVALIRCGCGGRAPPTRGEAGAAPGPPAPYQPPPRRGPPRRRSPPPPEHPAPVPPLP